MHRPVSLLSALVATLAGGVCCLPSLLKRQSSGLTLIQQLELAPTTVDRIALLTNDQDFVFDFNDSAQGITAGKGL